MESKVAILLILLILPLTYANSAPVEHQHLLIYEVSPSPYPGTNMEYVCILNPLSQRVELSGYYITDFEGKIPLNGSIAPHSKVYIAQNSTSFFKFFGFYPNFTYVDRFALANRGDEVALFYKSRMIDLLVYGDSRYSGPGWKGASVHVSTGHILRRIGMDDTNTSRDWSNYHVIGQSDFKKREFKASIEIFPYPDKWREVLRFLNSTKRSIMIESYTMDSLPFEGVLLKKLREGVGVSILLDGNPIGGMSDEEKYIVNELWKNGANIGFMVNDPKDGIYDRYRFLHAKFIVRDGSAVLISTENFGHSALSPCGNRGYGIIVRDEEFAYYVSRIFKDDGKNVQDIKIYDGEFNSTNASFKYEYELRRVVFESINITASLEPVIAPDFAPYSFKNFVDSQRDLKIEALYIGKDIWKEISNKTTLALVQHPYTGENVKRFDGMEHYIRYLHAKLIIGDSEVLVGSMNFGVSSMENNREFSLIIRSERAVSYLTKIFNYDWKGEFKPFPVVKMNIQGNRIHFDLSKSIGKDLTYYVYVDGNLVHRGKAPVFTINVASGTHKIEIRVEDLWGNERSICRVVNLPDSHFDLRIPIILLLVALFLYKIWKDHG